MSVGVGLLQTPTSMPLGQMQSQLGMDPSANNQPLQFNFNGKMKPVMGHPSDNLDIQQTEGESTRTVPQEKIKSVRCF